MLNGNFQKQHQTRAFNLLEIIIAISVFGVIGLGLTGSLMYGLGASQGLRAKQECSTWAEQIFMQIRRNGMVSRFNIEELEDGGLWANGLFDDAADDNDYVEVNAAPFDAISTPASSGLGRRIEVRRLDDADEARARIAVIRVIVTSDLTNRPVTYVGTVEI